MVFKNFVFLNQQEINGGKFEYEKRSEIPEKYKWELEDIYENESKWEASFSTLKKKGSEYKKFAGTLHESSEQLKNCFEFDEEIGIELDKLYLYAMLSKDIDLSDSKNNSRNERIMILHSELSAASSFIVPEILAMDGSSLWKFVEEQDFLKMYKHYFENLLRKKTHILSPRRKDYGYGSNCYGNSLQYFQHFR